MSLAMNSEARARAPLSTQRISYAKANDFLKLIDQQRPAQELSCVLSPGTYYIGTGNGVIQWNGQTAYHAPPNGEVEVFDYMKKTVQGGGAGVQHGDSRDLAYEVADVQRGRTRDQNAEVDSPWSRGWAEAERQEQLRR